MELKKCYSDSRVIVGFKQTEAGRLPYDWIVSRLGDLAPIQTGSTPPTRDQSNFGDDFPFVSPADMGGGKYISITEKRLSKKGFALSRPIPAGSVLFVCIGSTIGKRGLAAETLTSNQQINAVLPAKGISPDYMFYALSIAAAKVRALAGEQAVPLVNKSEFSETIISFPPSRAEQEAIAKALSDADALIESLEQLLAKKRQIKQGAMQELLTGKRRLPGFGGEWKVWSLGECILGSPSYGINAAAVPFSDLLPTYIRITDITDDGRFIRENPVSVQHAFVEHYFLEEGDLVFARTGASVGKSYLYASRDGRLVFAGFLIRVRPDPERLLASYLAAYAQTNIYRNWVRLMSMRSGQPGINGSEYAQLPLRLPSVEEQAAIATIISDMDAEIVALESKLAKARQVKQGMMQELLTGRIRLL